MEYFKKVINELKHGVKKLIINRLIRQIKTITIGYVAGYLAGKYSGRTSQLRAKQDKRGDLKVICQFF